MILSDQICHFPSNCILKDSLNKIYKILVSKKIIKHELKHLMFKNNIN